MASRGTISLAGVTPSREADIPHLLLRRRLTQADRKMAVMRRTRDGEAGWLAGWLAGWGGGESDTEYAIIPSGSVRNNAAQS